MAAESNYDWLARRVETLEARQGSLERLAEQLRADQAATGKRIEAIESRLQTLPASISKQLNAQTETLTRRIDERNQTMTDFVTDKLIEAARQWPTSAIVFTGAALTILIAIILHHYGIA